MLSDENPARSPYRVLTIRLPIATSALTTRPYGRVVGSIRHDRAGDEDETFDDRVTFSLSVSDTLMNPDRIHLGRKRIEAFTNPLTIDRRK